jgi:hypothetical protein
MEHVKIFLVELYVHVMKVGQVQDVILILMNVQNFHVQIMEHVLIQLADFDANVHHFILDLVVKLQVFVQQSHVCMELAFNILQKNIHAIVIKDLKEIDVMNKLIIAEMNHVKMVQLVKS